MEKEQTQVNMHRVAVDMYKMEKDQYWVRCNVILLMNSAFVVAFNSDKARGLITTIIPVMGACLSAAWLLISIHSEYYIKRWREIIRSIETDMTVQPFLSFPKDSVWFAASAPKSFLLVPYRWLLQGGPSRVINVVIVLFMAMWIIVGISGKPDQNSSGPGKLEQPTTSTSH